MKNNECVYKIANARVVAGADACCACHSIRVSFERLTGTNLSLFMSQDKNLYALLIFIFLLLLVGVWF